MSLRFRCKNCARAFPADADAAREVVLSLSATSNIGEAPEGMDIPGGSLWMRVTAAEIEELALSPEDTGALLAGEPLAVGGVFLCQECRYGKPKRKRRSRTR